MFLKMRKTNSLHEGNKEGALYQISPPTPPPPRVVPLDCRLMATCWIHYEPKRLQGARKVIRHHLMTWVIDLLFKLPPDEQSISLHTEGGKTASSLRETCAVGRNRGLARNWPKWASSSSLPPCQDVPHMLTSPCHGSPRTADPAP